MPKTDLLLFLDNGRVPVREWIDALPFEVKAACYAKLRLLREQGHTLRRPAVGEIGNDLWELRFRVNNIHHRIVYTFCGRNIVALLHSFTKIDKIPEPDLKRAVDRKKLVQSNPSRYTETFEIPHN
jgi:phage-related protein